jgi:DNA-binding NarL/FixJ family response regulator
MRFQVLLVEDHKILRDGIKAILDDGGEFLVMGETGNGTEAVQICKQQLPDIIVMDIGLQGLNGIEAAAEILRHCPEAKIIMLSIYGDEDSVASAIRCGARGFVLKKASGNELMDALRAVARGGAYLSPQISNGILQRMLRGELKTAHVSALAGLSTRELQVLRLVADGNSSKDIAAMLDLGLNTVRSYRKTLMRKLHVNNVAGLTQVAVRSANAAVPLDGYR